MAVKEKNEKKGGLPKPADCPTSHHVRIGKRGSHKGLTDEQAKKKELSPEAEKARRAASDEKLKTLEKNAEPIEKIKSQMKAAHDAGNADRVKYLRGVLKKERLKAPSAEDAVAEHKFERKVQEQARWTGVDWHCTDCTLGSDIDAVMEDGTVKEAKSNGKPERDQYRQMHLVGVPALFPKSNIHFAVPKGMKGSATQSMESTRDQQFMATPIQTH